MPFSGALVHHSCTRRVLGSPVAVTKDFTARRRRRWKHFSFFFSSNVTLIDNHETGVQDFSWSHHAALCFEHFDVVCHVRCQLTIRLPNQEKEKNIFPDSRCTERHCRHSSFKQQSDEMLSPMTINVEQEISSKLCALILGTQPWLAYSPAAQVPVVVFGWFARRYIFTDPSQPEHRFNKTGVQLLLLQSRRSLAHLFSPSVLHTARLRLCSGN